MVTVRDIEAAQARIRDSIYLSPCVRSQTLSALAGNSIYLKLDNLQMTGAFKERGALNRLLLLNAEEGARGVAAASAGNHAQAVAYHAARLGIRSTIVMPLNTPLVKVSQTKNFGARVILHGANYDEAFEEARRICDAESLVFVHAFDDEAVIAGQGTIGLEMLQQNPMLDAIVTPIGGGGLIGGLACAVKETNPRIRVIGVQTASLPSMKRAVEAGERVTLPPGKTIADGIAVRRAGELTLPLVEKYVDEIVIVDEEEIAEAILLLLEREKTVAEGAGAAALAAMLHHRPQMKDRRVGVVIGGGNIDVTLLSRIIERGLKKSGRLLKLRIFLPDHPGALMRLVTVIAAKQANIVETDHDRSHYGVSLGDTAVDIEMETRGPDHVAELCAALREAGYGYEEVR